MRSPRNLITILGVAGILLSSVPLIKSVYKLNHLPDGPEAPYSREAIGYVTDMTVSSLSLLFSAGIAAIGATRRNQQL
jgi:hypothetical protein